MATQIPRLEETVALMKDEIEHDVVCGFVPVQVTSFGDLHDYVDANEYGGFCDDKFSDELIAHFGGRDPVNEGMPDGMLDYINAAQTRIDAWLSAGGLEERIADRSWECFTPYMVGELLTKYKTAIRALDRIQSSTYADPVKLRIIAHEAYMEAK